MAQLRDLLVTGTSRFLGKVYATQIIANLTGNADTATSATKATQDESGNNIKSSYASSIDISDHTITLKNKNGDSLGDVTVPDNNTWRPLGTTADTACAGNDSRLSNARPASDVYSWAKASSKPSYSWDEITSKPSTFTPSSHTHNYAGSSSAGGAANSLSYFQNTSNSNMGQDTCNSNAIGYVTDYSGTVLTSNIKDGALYRQAYSTSWAHEIYGDYRSGQIAVRGKNNGTWQSWRRILDETNYKSFCTPANIGAATSSHTHNYAGSSSAGGSATSAVKLDSSAGSATQPVYFSDGKPVACSYTLGKSVPSDAVFTDTNTTYSAGTGISLSGTTFSNSGVRSISTGSSNGTISVDTNGTSADVAVKGLGTAAYTDYEEGTWTPTFNDTTYSNSDGEYKRIGNIVFFTAYFWSTYTSDINLTKVSGLPFSIKNGSGSGAYAGSTLYTNGNAICGSTINNIRRYASNIIAFETVTISRYNSLIVRGYYYIA